MKKIIFTTILFTLSAVYAHSDEFSMNAYVPARNANLYEVSFMCRADVAEGNPCTGFTIGTKVLDGNCISLVCDGANWRYQKSVWTQIDDYVYLSDPTPDDTYIGIGTINPSAKLHLVNNGGILAKGTFGSVSDGSLDQGAGTRFLWFPSKSATRAGNVTGTQWDEANMGNYSSAFGLDPLAKADYATIAGGDNNIIDTGSAYSFIGSGLNNLINETGLGLDDYNVIAGGQDNTLKGIGNFIGGGGNNLIPNSGYHTIVGGADNSIITTSGWATIGGGVGNSTGGLSGSTVCGGDSNSVLSGFGWGTIGGGKNNQIIPGDSSYSTIGGGEGNSVRLTHSFIGGGGASTINNTNSTIISGANTITDIVLSGANTVCGGYQNEAHGTTGYGTGGGHATVGGGKGNRAINDLAFVGGGGIGGNTASGIASVVGGGDANVASGDNAFIGGGSSNTASGNYAVIGGGIQNQATTSYTTIGGGFNNQATGNASTAVGGSGNTASGQYSISGAALNAAAGEASNATVGSGNTVNGTNSWVGGIDNVVDGDNSFAFGRNMTISAAADRTVTFGFPAATTYTTPDLFLIATGSVGIGPNALDPAGAGRMLLVDGTVNVLGDVWANGTHYPSDERFKENIVPIENSLENIRHIDGITFSWRKDKVSERKANRGPEIGVSAQNIEELYPSLVKSRVNGNKGVDYSKLVIPLVEAVKTLDEKAEALNDRISEIKKENKLLREKIGRLKRLNTEK